MEKKLAIINSSSKMYLHDLSLEQRGYIIVIFRSSYDLKVGDIIMLNRSDVKGSNKLVYSVKIDEIYGADFRNVLKREEEYEYIAKESHGPEKFNRYWDLGEGKMAIKASLDTNFNENKAKSDFGIEKNSRGQLIYVDSKYINKIKK